MNGGGSDALQKEQEAEWTRQHQAVALGAAIKYCSQRKYLRAFLRLDNPQRVDWVCGVEGFPNVPDRYWWRMLRNVFDHEILPGSNREFARLAWDGMTCGSSRDTKFRPLMMNIVERRFLRTLSVPCTVWRGACWNESVDEPGFSWTLDYDTAMRFIRRKNPVGKLFKATLTSIEDICYLDATGESEIFCVDAGEPWSSLQEVEEVLLLKGTMSIKES